MTDKIKKHLAAVYTGIQKSDFSQLNEAVSVLKSARLYSNTVWTFGNGGSAATASHLAVDLLKACKIRTICLTDLVPITTAYGNDEGWGINIQNMLSVVMRTGDVLIGISTSGQSPNVVHAMHKGMSTVGKRIAFTGPSKTSKLASSEPDVIIHTPPGDVRMIEDLHSIYCHAIINALEE